jgi:hypothetical protein
VPPWTISTSKPAAVSLRAATGQMDLVLDHDNQHGTESGRHSERVPLGT